MIDVLVWICLAIFAAVVILWCLDPRVRAHAEKPKVDMQERIRHFENEYPTRQNQSSVTRRSAASPNADNSASATPRMSKPFRTIAKTLHDRM